MTLITDDAEELELDTIGFRLACPEREDPPQFVPTEGHNELQIRTKTQAICECGNCWNRLKGWIRTHTFEEREELKREYESPLNYEKVTLYDSKSERYLSDHDGQEIKWSEELGRALLFEDCDRAVKFKLKHLDPIKEDLERNWDRLEFKRLYIQKLTP